MIFDIPSLMVSAPLDIYITFLHAEGKTYKKSLQYEIPLTSTSKHSTSNQS